MTFVDSNIPMYLVGAAHPHKVDAQRLVESLISRDERLVTDAEVLQEILHRHGVDHILSFAGGFDERPGIARISALS